MKRKPVILGGSLVAVAMLVTAGLLSCSGLQSQPPQPVTAKGPQVPIFVASEEIPAGEPVTSQRLKLKQWPEDQLPEAPLSRIEQVAGRTARVTIPAGEPVVNDKLVAIQ